MTGIIWSTLLDMKRVALLRGINVGGKRAIKMSDLREVLSEAGYEDVSTHIQSGNVIFRGSNDPQEMEAVIRQAFGFDVPVILRTREELLGTLSAMPFDPRDEDHSHQFIAFLAEPFLGDLPADPAKGGCAYLGKTEREVFSRWWKVEGKYAIPPTPKALAEATVRNRRVVETLVKLLEAD